jgi:predicted nucleic acid-binding protein
LNILVDSNVLLDIFTEDREWFGWSSNAVSHHTGHDILGVNPIIYAEISLHFSTIEELDDALPAADFRRWPLPWEAGFLAGRSFGEYRRRGGAKRSPLPDFYIGAHAVLAGAALLTRDAARYRTYFPRLKLIEPEK